MSVYLRTSLIVSSILACAYAVRKLRKSQIGLMDTLFWICLPALFIVLSVFPQIAEWGAALFGFISPANFIFLVVIALLMLQCFLLALRVSQMEDRLRNLVEELAIREAQKSDEIKDK